MKDILAYLTSYKTLTREQAYQVLLRIGQGNYTPVQITAFLTVFLMRGIRVEELEGFRDAMLELCLPVDLSEYDPMDVCGTGGDGKDTFNISTLAAFIVAGAGQRIAKHGNHGVSSHCGSSSVLEWLGCSFSTDTGVLKRNIERAGICLLHAPLFHPAMKHVSPIRKELGVKTFFNMLGPMVNPAQPVKQLVGVFNLELARLYAYLYQQSGKQFMILHTLDGYDEVSLTGPVKTITNQREQVLQPGQLGFDKLTPESLSGGDSKEKSARIFVNVLKNEGTPAQEQVVLANAAMALQVSGQATTTEEAIAISYESLRSGRAFTCFKRLVA